MTVMSSEAKRSRDIPKNQGDSSTEFILSEVEGLGMTPYFQVFSPENFIPNLSSFDLLFNCGPESKNYLLKTEN
jgi:hypothetical protein